MLKRNSDREMKDDASSAPFIQLCRKACKPFSLNSFGTTQASPSSKLLIDLYFINEKIFTWQLTMQLNNYDRLWQST